MWFKLFESFTPTSDSNTQIDGTKLVPTAFITSRQLALKSVQPKKKTPTGKRCQIPCLAPGNQKLLEPTFRGRLGLQPMSKKMEVHPRRLTSENDTLE